jgi:Domain of unknown function (DUF5666)
MSFSIKPQPQTLRTIVGHALCWLALFALSSCGGGISTASAPGTGGTGITTSGPIRGFGSVIVNGTRYDDSLAQVQIDGSDESSSALRLGMTAKVIGAQMTAPISATPTISKVGTATSIESWSTAQGLVKEIQLPNTLTVAGMSVVVDAGTVFAGLDSLADLRSDSVVKVWGLPSSVDYSQWIVTRIELVKAPQDTVSTGKVSVRGSKLTLNGMTLANAPTGLVDGQLIRVTGTITQAAEVILTVGQATLLAEAGSTSASAGYAEVQGIVSSILATRPGAPDRVTRLTLGASVVDISSADLIPSGATITVGMRLEVQGQWSTGTLVASQVKAISDQELKTVDVEGVIEAMAGIGNITIRGQRFDATSLASTFEAVLDGLRAGIRVRIVGVKKDGLVVATSIERK